MVGIRRSWIRFAASRAQPSPPTRGCSGQATLESALLVVLVVLAVVFFCRTVMAVDQISIRFLRVLLALPI